MTKLPNSDPSPSGFHYFDDALFLHLQGATQIDTLAHVAYDGLLYNGLPIGDITAEGAQRLGATNIGVSLTGRGVLLDIARLRGRPRLSPTEEITCDDLDAAEEAAGVRVGSGDMLLIRTGWLSVFTQEADRATFFASEPGLGLGTARWLKDRDVAFVAADNWGVEVSPTLEGIDMPLHCVLVRDMGMPLGEMFDLETIAAHAAETGRYEFHLSTPAMNIPGAVGSPATPVVTF
jgi:kynurenine formamidase